MDAFYCYQPARIDDNLLAYVEWSPNHTNIKIKDVVLLYDLDSTPKENRLGSEVVNFAEPGIRVGYPVYPEVNLSAKSYENVAVNDEDARQVVGSAPFTMLHSKWLVFVSASGGGDFMTLRNSLIAIDLSKGLKKAEIHPVSIPKSTLKGSGMNPEFIEVSGIHAASENSVLLSVPPAIYGVDKILVHIP